MDRIDPLPAWYVVFVDHGARVWWQRFLRPGFRHCFAFAWDGDADRWIVVNAGFDGATVRPMRWPAAAGMLTALHRAGARVLLAEAQGFAVTRPRLFLSCVSVIEALLGLPGPCVVSPWRLYRKLLSLGAREIAGDGWIYRRRSAESGGA